MSEKLSNETINISNQLQNLKDNNLIIEDEDYAAYILEHVSYYRLIKAYGPTFKQKNSKFPSGTTFNQIYRVYEFDDQLRKILTPYLQDIEISFRCQISNFFCEKYGSLGYLNSLSFDEEQQYFRLRNAIDRNISQAEKSPIVQHFKNNYPDSHLPLYAAIELFSFGTLAKFYIHLKNEDRSLIASLYENVTQYYLSNWLVCIAYIRNLCSHYNRLYEWNLEKRPKLNKRFDNGINNSRLFAVLCCMRFICKESGEWPSFVNALRDILSEYSDCVKPSGIGCPNNWYKKLLDQEPPLVYDQKHHLFVNDA